MSATLPTRLPRAVLFDWDNTLVDTWPTIHESLNVTLTAMGHAAWTMEETKIRVRRSLRESFPELFGDRWEHARDLFYSHYEKIHLHLLAVRPGAEDALRYLKEQGAYLGVVSNKSGPHLRGEAEHLGWSHYFGRVVGATDAPRDKPDPCTIDLALSAGMVKPGPEVWFVGDTWIDMECAARSGCVAVLVREEPPAQREFHPHEPDLHVRDFTALLGLARQLARPI
jgi:phosphoglycolate phosphatase